MTDLHENQGDQNLNQLRDMRSVSQHGCQNVRGVEVHDCRTSEREHQLGLDDAQSVFFGIEPSADYLAVADGFDLTHAGYENIVNRDGLDQVGHSIVPTVHRLPPRNTMTGEGTFYDSPSQVKHGFSLALSTPPIMFHFGTTDNQANHVNRVEAKRYGFREFHSLHQHTEAFDELFSACLGKHESSCLEFDNHNVVLDFTAEEGPCLCGVHHG